MEAHVRKLTTRDRDDRPCSPVCVVCGRDEAYCTGVPEGAEAPAPKVSTVRIERVCPGFYRTSDGRIRVQRYDRWSVWSAFLVDKVGRGPEETYKVARGRTFVEVRSNLRRYLDDEVNDRLGKRSRYGFHGDSRPVASPNATSVGG